MTAFQVKSPIASTLTSMDLLHPTLHCFAAVSEQGNVQDHVTPDPSASYCFAAVSNQENVPDQTALQSFGGRWFVG